MSVLVADVKCTFLGDEVWSLGSPLADSHIAWEFLKLHANALLGYCIKRMDMYFHFLQLPFKRGLVLFSK